MGSDKIQKPGSKPRMEIIPFTDLAIKNWRPPIKSISRVGFVLSSITKGLKVVSYGTPNKHWILNYSLKGKEKTILKEGKQALDQESGRMMHKLSHKDS